MKREAAPVSEVVLEGEGCGRFHIGREYNIYIQTEISTVVLRTVETEYALDRNCATSVSESRSPLYSSPPHGGNCTRS